MKSAVLPLSGYKTLDNKRKAFYSLWMFPLIAEWLTTALTALSGWQPPGERKLKPKNEGHVQMETKIWVNKNKEIPLLRQHAGFISIKTGAHALWTACANTYTGSHKCRSVPTTNNQTFMCPQSDTHFHIIITHCSKKVFQGSVDITKMGPRCQDNFCFRSKEMKRH